MKVFLYTEIACRRMTPRDRLAREARQLRCIAECALDPRIRYRLLRRANVLSVKAAKWENETLAQRRK